MKKNKEVSISFDGERWEATMLDEMLPFYSTPTIEEMEAYCHKNKYDIVLAYGEDGEAL